MSKPQEARRILKELEDRYHPAVNYLRLRKLGDALELETREEWSTKRVKEEFLLPYLESLLAGSTNFEVEASVWKRLGLVDSSTPANNRDFYGRKKRGTSGSLFLLSLLAILSVSLASGLPQIPGRSPACVALGETTLLPSGERPGSRGSAHE